MHHAYGNTNSIQQDRTSYHRREMYRGNVGDWQQAMHGKSTRVLICDSILRM